MKTSARISVRETASRRLSATASTAAPTPSRCTKAGASSGRTASVAPEPAQSRRQMLAAAGLLLTSSLAAPQANASYVSNVCTAQTTAELGEDCRMAVLGKDAGRQEDYSKVAGSGKVSVVQNVPAAVLDQEYVKSTRTLSEQIRRYATMDPLDKARPQLAKTLKAECLDWVGKYARGGSARSQSARRMYIAADSLVGQFASNGLAPLPRPKVTALLKTLDEVDAFLAQS